MKTLISSLVVLLFLVARVGLGLAETAPDIAKHPSCAYCGMDRQQFAHSRVLIIYEDGSEFGACSIHCAALNLVVSLDKNPKQMLVADFNQKNLVEAEKATWVIGGDKPGVMTKNAKWAFATPAAAEAFIREHKGKMANFDDVMQATFEDMYSDYKMIREKRAKMKVGQQHK